ncbi:MAG: hypothetical protein IT325_09785 [Anaerolineae bacterium]|nr:hypothetical protein [Anaerolineae bacterium]
MLGDDLQAFARHVDVTFEAFGSRRLSEGAVGTWFKQLQGFALRDVCAELDDCVRRLTRPPACADVWKSLNERRSEHIEKIAEASKAAEKRDADNLFAGRTPIGEEALAELRKLLQKQPIDPKAWAHRIIDRYCDGDSSINPTQLAMACRALGYSTEDLAVIRGNR